MVFHNNLGLHQHFSMYKIPPWDFACQECLLKRHLPCKILIPHLVCSCVLWDRLASSQLVQLIVCHAHKAVLLFRPPRVLSLSHFHLLWGLCFTWYLIPVRHIRHVHLRHCLQPATKCVDFVPSIPVLAQIPPSHGGCAIDDICYKNCSGFAAGLPVFGKTADLQESWHHFPRWLLADLETCHLQCFYFFLSIYIYFFVSYFLVFISDKSSLYLNQIFLYIFFLPFAATIMYQHFSLDDHCSSSIFIGWHRVPR